MEDGSELRTHDNLSRALIIEARILRRVIRLDRRLATLGLTVPHATNYVIDRARLLAYTEVEELGLPPTTDLPRDIILLAKSSDEDLPRGVSRDQVLTRYERHRFHAQIHLELARQMSRIESPAHYVERRWQQIGKVEFDEIRMVLHQDQLLFPDSTEVEIYIEFVAVYLELKYFAPDQLPAYFPAISDWSNIDRIVSLDVDHGSIYQAAHAARDEFAKDPTQASAPVVPPIPSHGAKAAVRIRTHRLPARANRAANQGNSVKAAILWTLGTEYGIPNAEVDTTAAAHAELERLVVRLRPVLNLTDDSTQAWVAALHPLLKPAASGFWTVEARLLYDLQKVCVEHERGIFKYDLVRWIRQGGREPLRRALPLLREVLITKHLRSAARRLSSARLTPAERERFSTLLSAASVHAEQRVRMSIRPLALKVFDNVGLKPANLLDRVGRLTVVEELLDVIVEQGVANLGHLRDAISRNDIKLPDLGGATELVHGDLLLLADRQLANDLAGLYRPGAIYLRSAQRLSSIAFGTRTGRFITRYAALPFGGAYLAMEGMRHLIDFLSGKTHHTGPTEPPVIVAPVAGHTESLAVMALGTFLLLLMHVPGFRAWCQLRARLIWNLVHTYIVALPVRIFNSPLVQDFLRSPVYSAVRSYVVWPAIVTGLFRVVGPSAPAESAMHWSIETFLATALFLNSRIGRYVDERLADLILRTWQELRMRVFAALFEWIMDTFRRVFAYLERLVYTVDEWLRFRAGDNRVTQGVKLLSGTCWSFVSYFVIVVFTLLIEPQVNPIKHFPVVTVSHKLILPASTAMIEALSPLTGVARARTIVWSTILLIPGVFGFLVWELRANWRLYEANRPRRLMPTPVGHHGETMLRLLRPGFHSGTLPKSFAALRRALQAAQDDQVPSVERKLAVLRRVEESIRRFVDRKLLLLWNESQSARGLAADITHLHISTSRISLQIEMRDRPLDAIQLTWHELDNRFVVRATTDSWLEQLDADARESCVVGLTGLAQFSAAEMFEIRPLTVSTSPLDWRAWEAFWANRGEAPAKLHQNFTTPTAAPSATTS